MEIANLPRIKADSITIVPAAAARDLKSLSYGPMAVMASPVLDTSPSDLKASVLAPSESMGLDAATNG